MRSLDIERARYGFERVLYGDAPSILLVGSGDVRRGRHAAAEAGFRVVGEECLADAAGAIASRAAVDVILVDAEAGAIGHENALAAELNRSAQNGSRIIVIAPDVEALSSGRGALAEGVLMLSSPNGFEILQCLQASAVRENPAFHDVKNAESPRLQQLSAEVGRIANILASLSEEERGEEANGQIRPRVDAGLVRAIIRARRLRDHYFRSELFADPAWDMLLDLYAARLDHQRVAVSSLCIAAAVPATTALRWIKSLTDQKLFVRIADPQDGRRVFIELSDEAAAGLEAYLIAAHRISPIIA